MCCTLATYIISRMKNEKGIRAQEHKSTRGQEHKGKIKLCTYALMSCALIVAGCARQQQYPTIENIQVPDANKAEAMQIAEDVLVRMHFNIEKADYESGIIKTWPLTGAQFFEFWRKDNVGAFNAAEANLHSIRRIVELHISRYGLGSSIDCNVQVQKLNVPTSNEPGQRPSIQGIGRFPREAGASWADLGKDSKLATRILKRIENRVKREE